MWLPDRTLLCSHTLIMCLSCQHPHQAINWLSCFTSPHPLGKSKKCHPLLNEEGTHTPPRRLGNYFVWFTGYVFKPIEAGDTLKSRTTRVSTVECHKYPEGTSHDLFLKFGLSINVSKFCSSTWHLQCLG